jgi:transmembrane sensor
MICDGAQRGSLPRTAAEWFAVRLQPHDAELEQHFSAWLAQDAKNLDEYALCGLTWELSGAVSQDIERELANRPSRFRGRLAYAVGAVVVVLSVFLALYRSAPPAAGLWRTGPGEQRTVALEDGSRITMNTRSSLQVRMGRSKREIRLLAGEAFFEVAKDTSRPFVVKTQLGEARAVGTRFNVLLEGEREEIATEEGKVLVKASAAKAAGVLATAGIKATLIQGEASPALGEADLVRVENWRAHRLEFDRVPLEAALKEISRYTPLPVRARSLDVQRMRISAVLRTGDIQAFKGMLKAAFGLDVIEGNGEWLVVMPDDDSASHPDAHLPR